jgi:KaiC/GvpD/RAD55 family RecA-like ATPase
MLLTAEELEEVAPGPPRVEKLRRLDVAYMAANEPPAVDWIAQGLVAREAVTMIHGAAGLGKSMLALALGVAVARGAPFMNYSTTLGRVLYVDAENGQGEAHRRIRALNLTPEEADRLAYFEALSVDLVKDEKELRGVAIEEKPDLIVVDSLATVNRNDEDSSRDMTPTLQVLQRLARASRAGVLVLHHDKKDRTTLRGSSAIEAVVEIRWHLTKEEEREGARRLTNEKCRLAAESPERWVEIRQTPAGIEVTQVAKPPTTKEADLWSEVVDLLSDGQTRTNREIAADIGCAAESGSAPGNLSRLIKDKREAGYLIAEGRGGVKLAPHLLTSSAPSAEPVASEDRAPDPDPLILPYGEGSEDQPGAAA